MKKLFILIALITPFVLSAQQLSKAGRKLSLAEYAISNFYVDSLNEDKLVEDAIVALLEKLDPHSSYSTVEETKEMNEPLLGNFDGIGIQFQIIKDTLFVIQTIAGGPSEKVGVLPGDKIVMVNDTVIAGVKMKQSDIMRRLRGKKGTYANIGIKRNNKPQLLSFRIARDKIPIYSIDASYMVEPTVGYIKINRFAATTHEEFVKAVQELKQQGMKSLIVDLQGNGGGFLNAAIDMVDEFLPQDQLIVYTEGAKQSREEAFSTKAGDLENTPVVILIDEGSASASEIMSGAIQDWDRGVIVGRRSFGKGLVQRPIPLPDGSMIRLTVARYYTPSGRSIQKPYSEGTKKYYEDLLNRYKSGELMHADSTHFPDSLKTKTLKEGRVVYGGGGIMPDVFIPIDTTRFTDYHRDLVYKGVINQFVATYVDSHRQSLKKNYKDVSSYIKGFEVNQTILDELIKQGTEEGITFNQEQFDKAKPMIELQLKALIGRDLFDTAAYYQIMNNKDDAYKKALEIIKDPTLYSKYLKN
ncbi:MAG: S41 family peptidase [Bacteroidales bacterium]